MWDDESPQDHKPKEEECLMANIIAGRKAIGKFFYQYGFGEKLSSVPQKRLGEMICGLAMKGNQSRTTDFAELNQGYRTTYGHFLSKGKWDEQAVSQNQQKESFQKAAELALEKRVPLYLSIDDTVIEKKKPSSRATHPMEGTGWHYSHLEGKQVFGYQVFGANISVGNVSLCYCLRRCCSESGSKIDMAVQLLDKLPETEARVILQMDSWYTCKALWDKALEKDITLIGAMKTNRILYPDGHRCNAQDYAAMLPNDQYHLVTVGGHEYWIHRYEGALNGIDKAVVLLSYPKDAFGNKKALRVFICSDLDLSVDEILSHYTHRWKIEVMFKQHKMYLGLKSFMVRSAKAIDRLFVIFPLAHFFFIAFMGDSLPLPAAIRRFRCLLGNS